MAVFLDRDTARMPITTRRAAFWKGYRESTPFFLVSCLFGLLFGVLAAEAGLGIIESMAFTVLLFAGSVQFTALQLMQEQAPVLIVLVSALAVNLRVTMYSAALTPQLGQAPGWQLAYCDLNPIRAQMATTPETSDYTSIKQRIECAAKGNIPKTLCRFQGSQKKDQTPGIPFALQDYIDLVDATGRIMRDNKRGHIDNDALPILQRLDIDADTWLHITTTFEDRFGRGHPGMGGR